MEGTLREELDDLQAASLRSLSSPHRVRLIHLLAAGRREVRDIADRLGMSQATASQHLAALRAAGLVEARRDGRNVAYELADPDIALACSLMREVLVRRLRRLGRLGQLAAATSRPTVATAVEPRLLEVPTR